MSKIICDVCGTSYAETATQCPICGCARPGEVLATVNDDNEAVQSSGYTYVKGGRFSKANVRKRNKAMQAGAAEAAQTNKQAWIKNKWLWITAAILLLTIIAVILFVVLSAFGSYNEPEATEPSASVAEPTDTVPVTDPEPTETDPVETEFVEVPCTVLLVSHKNAQLDNVGDVFFLDVTAGPIDTTDTIIYESSDITVATVDDAGMITAVGGGQAEITITCGAIQQVCTVTCTMETEPVIEETEPPVQTDPPVELVLNRSDFTLRSKGSSWNLYSGELDPSKISWKSSNTAVVTVTDGKVVAVGPGRAVITAEYNGSKATCVVYCSFSGTSGSGGGITEEGSGNKTYKISHSDVTLPVGDTFVLTIKDEKGNVQTVQWSSNVSDICSISGNTIKGLKAGKTVVSVTFEGVLYQCIVRVINS